MAERGRSWRRRVGRALRRSGRSPARMALLAAVALAAVALVGAAAALPWWLRARFEAQSAAREELLTRASGGATAAFVESGRAVMLDAAAAADAALVDPTRPLAGLEVWQGGERVLPPAFSCRPVDEPPEELALAGSDVIKAARAHDPAQLERAMRAWLALRAHHRIAPVVDLASSLEPLEAAADSGLVEGGLLRSLLTGGLEVGAERVPALEAQALLGWPSSCDEALLARVGALLVKNGVDDTRLRARLAEWRALPETRPPVGVGSWVGGDDTFAQLEPGGRALLVRSDVPAQAARAAVAALGVSSALLPIDGARWRMLDEVALRLAALEELAPARARFDAMLRALSVAAATLAGGTLLLVAIDRRRRRGNEALRRDLVAAVAHELKTPLASMRLQADALERWVADERAGKTLARLQEDVDALEGLVENVLSWGRLSRGGVVLREAEVSLLDLCREALERATREQPGLSVELCGDDVIVRADGDLLRLVLGNLVRNAWRHNPRAQKRVRVAVERAGRQAVVSVADNGVGIDAAERARIFRPFERSLTLARGSGLGLTLGREIAALHGGDVRLAQTGAEGSTFVLELPA